MAIDTLVVDKKLQTAFAGRTVEITQDGVSYRGVVKHAFVAPYEQFRNVGNLLELALEGPVASSVPGSNGYSPTIFSLRNGDRIVADGQSVDWEELRGEGPPENSIPFYENTSDLVFNTVAR